MAVREPCVSFSILAKVRHRRTDSLYKVVRWDQEGETLLLAPVASPLTDRSGNSNDSTGEEGARTRWAFERMVSLVEKSQSTSKGVNFDPTPFARRAAKLDSRVEIRHHSKRSRGRGLFAARNLPRGTEVMRVPAAVAV